MEENENFKQDGSTGHCLTRRGKENTLDLSPKNMLNLCIQNSLDLSPKNMLNLCIQNSKDLSAKNMLNLCIQNESFTAAADAVLYCTVLYMAGICLHTNIKYRKQTYSTVYRCICSYLDKIFFFC